jgi:hypothetical protein
MNTKKRSFIWLAGGLLALMGGSVALLSLSQAQLKDDARVAATYRNGVLHVSIPYTAPRNGEGNLIVEVLDPEDHIAGRLDRTVSLSAGQGFAEQELVLPGSPAIEDLVWYRLRYRFLYRGDRSAALKGISAVSKVVHVLSQGAYAAGEEAAVRLVVTEADGERPITSGTVRIELVGAGQKPRALYAGSLNAHGSTQAQLRFPEGLLGAQTLRYTVDTPLGEARQEQQIQLERRSSILLTTEKPVYQPGQTIHVRALALDRADHHATGNRNLTFEVEDSRGNKVFRATTHTDDYGVASAEFGLADEVNLGTYHLRALMDEANQSEIALQVERYVLPKFKVDIDLASRSVRVKRGYRPGDHVTGTVRSNYFFGKAVDHAEVVVKVSAMDVMVFEAGKTEGKTDGEGAFAFDLRLPEFLAGRSASQGAARVSIEATVRDNAGHSETHAEMVTVSESPLLVTAVAEGGAMTPGVENQVFILTSYPDGTPARAELRIHAPRDGDQTVHTDEGGVAIVSLHGMLESTAIRVEAKDGEGNKAAVALKLDSRTGLDPLVLHTEQGLYRAGERVRMQVFCSRRTGSVCVDVLEHGQTVATHELELQNGGARLDFVATPAMAGALELNAYMFDQDGRVNGDRRIVFVQPADELRIETSADSPVYKPGSEARIGFRVTNRRGEGVQAALGVAVVDQAVFALAEKQPGFAKVFFYLEQEMMKPRFEIHSIGLPEVISTTERGGFGRQDRAARALFSALETGKGSPWLKFGGDEQRRKQAEYRGRYQARLHARTAKLAEALQRAEGESGFGCSQVGMDARLSGTDLADPLTDPWGNKVRVSFQARNSGMNEVRSAGPDGQFGTADDLTDQVPDPWCRQGSGYTNTVRIRMERSADAGLTEVSGTVADMTGAFVPSAFIRIVEAAGGRVRALRTDVGGRFGFTSLRAGRYRIEVTSPGFRAVGRDLVLQAGDRAVVSVDLQLGMFNEMPEVQAGAMVLNGVRAMAAPMALLFTGAATGSDAGVNIVLKDRVAQREPAADAHVRSWFPESLYVAPQIITDREGRASVTIPIADSITTWRMAMLASTRQGALGSGTASLKVFQDFFTEMDLPVTLTQGDEVSIPVAVYNYAGSRGDVRLRLEGGDWYSLEGDVADKSISVEPGRVAGSQFTIAAKRVGKFRLTLRAEMAGKEKRADIVVREIEVVPNGREQSMVFNGRVEHDSRQEVNFLRRLFRRPMRCLCGCILAR